MDDSGQKGIKTLSHGH
jgi:hypothetical protein